MSYIFLKNENNDFIYATDSDKIETLLLSETYDSNGQLCCPSDCGDYLILDNQMVVNAVNNFVGDDKYVLGDMVLANENISLFEFILNLNRNIYEYSHYGITVKGFNYWNGNNWRSIIIENDFGYTEWAVITDKSLIKRLKTAITRKRFISESFGIKNYHFGNVEITYSCFQSAWETYKIVIN